MSDIDNMLAGRELDALVAEKVMGWRWLLHEGFNLIVPPDAPGRAFPGFIVNALPGKSDGQRWGDWANVGWWDDENHQYGLPRFSTKIADAWPVVEKLLITVAPYRDNWWHAADGKVIAYAETAPLAICRAALKAVLA